MTIETQNTNPVKTTMRRRWFRFRLRTLLIMVTLMSIPLVWVGWELDQRRREKPTIAWVEEMRGSCDTSLFAGLFSDKRSRWEKTRDKWFGERVQFVWIANTQVIDLKLLTDLKNLRKIILDNTHVSDYSHLAELKKLELLGLVNTQVSDEQVEELRLALPNCEILID